MGVMHAGRSDMRMGVAHTKRLLSEAEQESDDLQSQIAAAESSEIVPEQVIKTGFAVLQDMATFWQEASLAI